MSRPRGGNARVFTQTLPRLLGGGDATIGQKVRLALSGHAGHVRLPLDQQPRILERSDARGTFDRAMATALAMPICDSAKGTSTLDL